jgi:hypothetical protein
MGVLTPYYRKSAETLYSNVSRLISLAPSINHIGFLTLTFKDNVKDHKEAYKRFRSFNSNFLSPHPDFGEYVCVKERQTRGAWHYHMVVILKHDIRTDFDFDGYSTWLHTRKLGDSNPYGSKQLRSLWSQLYDALPKYGMGKIFSLEPVKSNEEAMSRYVGKYISKHLGARTEDDKGVRLINYSKGWSKNSSKFQWYTPGSMEWRRKLSLFARLNGCEDLYDLTQKLGPRWPYNYLNEIMDIDVTISESAVNLSDIKKDVTPSKWLSDFIGRRERHIAWKEERKTHICPGCSKKAPFRLSDGYYYCLRCGYEIF